MQPTHTAIRLPGLAARIGCRRAGLVIAAAMALALAGCSDNGKSPTNSNPSPSPPSGHSSHFHTVDIHNLAFNPADLTIAVNDTVSWSNSDNQTHTVTSDTGTELNGTLDSGGNYQHVFATAGSNPYHCAIHPFMHGSVTVQ